MSTEKIEERDFILAPQPSYSPDLAPCDFFLFGYRKLSLEGRQFTAEDQLISAIREIVDKTLLQASQNMMNDW
jgi:hypothetical protein